MKIHTLAQKTGLTAPTIRFYEKEGLLDTRHVQRGANRYREYNEGAVKHILMLKKLQAAGFTLAELEELVEGEKVNAFPLQRKIEHIRIKMEEIEQRKAELEQIQTYLTQLLERKMALMEAEEKSELV
jgi:DNA-binding transcriptional MerR regulator